MGLEKADPASCECETCSREMGVQLRPRRMGVNRQSDIAVPHGLQTSKEYRTDAGQNGLTTTSTTMMASAIPGNSPQIRNCFSVIGRSPAIIFFARATMMP